MALRASFKRLIFIGLSIVLFLAAIMAYSSFVRPAYEDLIAKRSSLENRINLVAENELVVGKMRSLLNEYKNAEALKTSVSAVLPTIPDAAAAINQISALAKINNLVLNSVSTSLLSIKPSAQPALVKGIGSIQISCQLSGNYASFRSFLKNIETNINLMDIDTVRISQSGGNMIYTIGIVTYYQAE